MIKDEQLEFDVFRCPSDVGFEPGRDGGGRFGAGVYMGMGEWFSDTDSWYNVLGNSYATDSILLGGPGYLVTTIGPYLRPYSQVPTPSRRTLLKESKGYYGSGWNQWFGPQRDDKQFTWGNHGKLRSHMTAFVDGHAEEILYEVRTDAEGFDFQHTGRFALRGGRLEDVAVNGIDEFGNEWSFSNLAHLMFSGPGWADHCFPAPAVQPGPRW